MRTRRRRLECESLEGRALLSGAGMMGHGKGLLHAPVVRALHRPAAFRAQMVRAAAATGGGLVNVPSAPVGADVQGLQSVASGNNLVLFLAQFEALSGSNPATRQLAASILNDARDVDLALDTFAGGIAVPLPGGVAGADQAIARQMIAAVRSGTADQAFSTLIVQAEANLVGRLQQLAAGAQEASIRTMAAGLLPTVQADLAAAQGTGTLAPVSQTPTSTALNPTDLSTLSTYYAINAMERFLGQLTALVSSRAPLVNYAEKLVGDHGGAMVALGAAAASTGSYVPAGIPASDAMMAQSIVAALGPARARSMARYDNTYLRKMIQGHTQALQFSQQVIATSQNPALRQFAIDVVPTITMHRLAARAILFGLK